MSPDSYKLQSEDYVELSLAAQQVQLLRHVSGAFTKPPLFLWYWIVVANRELKDQIPNWEYLYPVGDNIPNRGYQIAYWGLGIFVNWGNFSHHLSTFFLFF